MTCDRKTGLEKGLQNAVVEFPKHAPSVDSHNISSMAPLWTWYTAYTTTICIIWCEFAMKSNLPGIHFSGILKAPMKPPTTATKSCWKERDTNCDRHEDYDLDYLKENVSEGVWMTSSHRSQPETYGDQTRKERQRKAKSPIPWILGVRSLRKRNEKLHRYNNATCKLLPYISTKGIWSNTDKYISRSKVRLNKIPMHKR